MRKLLIKMLRKMLNKLEEKQKEEDNRYTINITEDVLKAWREREAKKKSEV